MLILRSLQPASLQHVSVTYRSFFKMVLLIPCGLWLTTIALHHGTITLGLIVAGVSVYSHVRRGIVWAVRVVLVLNVRLARDVGRRQGGLTAWRVYAVHAAPVHLVHVRRMLRWPLHLLRETVTEVRWFSYRWASIAGSFDFGKFGVWRIQLDANLWAVEICNFEFYNYRTPKLYNLFRTQEPQNSGTSELMNLRTQEPRNSGTSEPCNFRTLELQNGKTVRFQKFKALELWNSRTLENLEILEPWDSRTLEHRNTGNCKTSGPKNFRLSNFESDSGNLKV